ncbi:hypothetical protein A2U01_0075768, partial [Trifolium medium]|nr:hypothetical protein [Trifolium medium]
MPISLLTWALFPFVLTMASVCGPLWPVRHCWDETVLGVVVHHL